MTSLSHELFRVRVNHERCFLLRLPTELRIQVYRLLIGARHVHITPYDTFISSQAAQGAHQPSGARGSHTINIFPSKGDVPEQEHLTPIWRVCREIYFEASIFLYTDNVFSFQTTQAATAFFNNLRPAQRESLRIIGLPGLKEFHAIRMPCLKRLTGLRRVELLRTPRERDHAVKKLAAAFPGKTVDVVYLSEQTITEVREMRRRARFWR